VSLVVSTPYMQALIWKLAPMGMGGSIEHPGAYYVSLVESLAYFPPASQGRYAHIMCIGLLKVNV